MTETEWLTASIPRRHRFALLASLVVASTTLTACGDPATQPARSADDPRVHKELQTIVDSLVPPAGQPADENAISEYREQAKAAAKTALDSSGTPDDAGLSRILPARRPFDDASNRQFVAKAREMMMDFRVDPPAAAVALMEQDKKHALTGAKLELLADLEEGLLKIMRKQMDGPRKNS